ARTQSPIMTNLSGLSARKKGFGSGIKPRRCFARTGRPRSWSCRAAAQLSLWSSILFLGASMAGAQFQKFASHLPLDVPALPAGLKQKADAPPWQGDEPGPVAGLKLFAREKSGPLWLGGDQ